jgi:2,3-bisphosphoglycerate-independent phosphoglycerate mutase
MKYIVLIGDGMAGRPLKALGNKTCLQYARTPHMDELAQKGQAGWARTVPAGFEPGSDVANLSILGYNPSKYYSGRAPIEAEYRGIKLGPQDIAFRCNLVNLNFHRDNDIESSSMNDFSAGHITTPESRRLIKFIDEKLGSRDIKFYAGVSYRHLMIWKKGTEKMKCIPPHDITGKKVKAYLPKGRGGEVLYDFMRKSNDILPGHAVNKARVKKGLTPANSIWLWGQGGKLTVPKFKSKYGLNGALISAVDLTKGLGICAGFDVLNVKGATGYIDTNYQGKANAALRALKSCDFVYVHVEAPDEAGHSGSMKDKIRAIEDFDSKIVAPIRDGVKKFGDYKILLMPDHLTPISVRTHTSDPVPFVMYSSNNELRNGKSRTRSYSENICRMKSALKFEKGYTLMDYFLKGKVMKG